MSRYTNVQEIVARLRVVRRRLGLSEERCAHELGVTYSTLSRWERGEARPRSQVVLRAIEQFLATHQKEGAR